MIILVINIYIAAVIRILHNIDVLDIFIPFVGHGPGIAAGTAVSHYGGRSDFSENCSDAHRCRPYSADGADA